jgi:phospholipid transport system substrate-binding protein
LTRSKTPISDSDGLPTRRALLMGGAALAVGAVLPASPVRALTEPQAKALIQRLVDEINAVIESGAAEASMLRSFEALFVKYADTDFMARYALGADGRAASDADIRAFTAAFQTYISRKYGRRFREFVGGRLEVDSVATRKSIIEVKGTAYLTGEAPFEVTFQLSNRSGENQFVNMFIEGVNLLLSERTEIGAMLDKRGGSISRLADDLRNI